MSNAALITITSINLVVSSITMGGLVYAAFKGRRMKAELEAKITGEVDLAKSKASDAVRALRATLDTIDL